MSSSPLTCTFLRDCSLRCAFVGRPTRHCIGSRLASASSLEARTNAGLYFLNLRQPGPNTITPQKKSAGLYSARVYRRNPPIPKRSNARSPQLLPALKKVQKKKKKPSCFQVAAPPPKAALDPPAISAPLLFRRRWLRWCSDPPAAWSADPSPKGPVAGRPSPVPWGTPSSTR